MPTPARLILATCFTFVLAAAPPFASACDTPVYRYAMYRWQPTPYEVYFFHDQEPDAAHVRVAELLDHAGAGSEARANVVHIPVNLAEDKELNSVPHDIKQAWNARKDKSLPAYLVSTPYGVGLDTKPLDEPEVEAMLDSPARKQLGAELETGKVGVIVLLTGGDAEANAQAEKVVAELAGEVAKGDVELYESPNEVAPTDGEADVAEGSGHELAILQVARDSEEERWFVRSLLATHPALAEDDSPVAFLVYGRARALRPYVGGDITRDNLLAEIEFVTGKCSCTVKEQNPGIDLLVRYDWESASAALAEKFGSEEGNESQFGPDMFFPELIIPSAAEAEPAAELASAAPSDTESDPTDGENATGDQLADASDDIDTALPPVVTSAADAAEVASVTPIAPRNAEPTAAMPSAFASVWVVGAGIAVTLLVLFGLTFVVLKPQ